MKNITVIVTDEVHRHARIWAAQHETSVSAVVQYMLSTLNTEPRAKAFLAARANASAVKKTTAPPPPKTTHALDS